MKPRERARRRPISIGLPLLAVALSLGSAFVGSSHPQQRQDLSPQLRGGSFGSTAPLHASSDLERFVAPSSHVPGHKIFACVRAVSLLLTLLIGGVWVVPAVLGSMILDPQRKQRKWVDLIICAWSTVTVWPYFKVKVLGGEHLPKDGKACIYVANHQSFMDILSSYHIFRSFKFVSKSSILKIPLVGWVMKRAKTVTIQREDRRSQVAAFRACVDALKKGTSIFIFPEGTRSMDGKLLEFKRGPISMAKKAGVPVQPITIRGTGRLMPSKKEYLLYCNRAGVEIVVHPQISAEEVKDTGDEELLGRVKRTIEAALPPQLQSTGA
ncbi:unnamed protein product [Effrenium voratum]|nr:unnamed protein product [Effrenium voratum]